MRYHMHNSMNRGMEVPLEVEKEEEDLVTEEVSPSSLIVEN